MSCVLIARAGCSEQENKREPEPELSFIEAHAAFETV
jgi:hypothetical protein